MVIYVIVSKGKQKLNSLKFCLAFIFNLNLNSNNEIVLGANHSNIPRILQVIIDCFIRDGIDMENLVAKRMINICKHVQVK